MTSSDGINWMKLWLAYDKRRWTVLMMLDSAHWFPGAYAKPIAPTLKRWRRLRRLLMQEERND